MRGLNPLHVVFCCSLSPLLCPSNVQYIGQHDVLQYRRIELRATVDLRMPSRLDEAATRMIQQLHARAESSRTVFLTLTGASRRTSNLGTPQCLLKIVEGKHASSGNVPEPMTGGRGRDPGREEVSKD